MTSWLRCALVALLVWATASLAQAPEDTSQAFASRHNYLLSFPRLVWTAVVYPLGAFTIYAERTELPRRTVDFFTNADHTFGIFPQVQLGGETGSGGGFRSFHTNLFNRGEQFEALYVFSRTDRHHFQALYRDPNLAGSAWYWEGRVDFLHTDDEDATINGAAEEEELFRFRLEQLDLASSLGWRRNAGTLEAYTRGFSLEGRIGYGQRDLVQVLGPVALSTPQASLVWGLGQRIALFSVGARIACDDRDYTPPVNQVSHPLNYRFPGRVLAWDGQFYHHFRDLSYPERGGLLQAGAELVAGEQEVRFWRLTAEAQHFFTLFWRNRILALRARLEKAHRLEDGNIPYADLPTLGGSQRLRGYHRGGLRGEGALLLSGEYRYPIWDTWNAFLFWDEGQVFDEYGQVELDRFHTSWGGGVVLRTEQAFLVSLRLGHSAVERALVGFSLEQEF